MEENMNMNMKTTATKWSTILMTRLKDDPFVPLPEKEKVEKEEKEQVQRGDQEKKEEVLP